MRFYRMPAAPNMTVLLSDIMSPRFLLIMGRTKKLFLITYALLVWFRDELVLNGLPFNSGLSKESMPIDGSPKKS